MRITRITAISLIGVLFILGACASPAATTPVTPAPVAATTPVTPAPVAAATPVTPAPVAAATPVTPAPAVPASMPAQDQTAFVLSNLAMDQTCVMGDNVTASVLVTNTGKQRGTYTVVLKFNGDAVKAQDITLDGGSSGNVQLTVVTEAMGDIKVTIGQLTTKLNVAACPE